LASHAKHAGIIAWRQLKKLKTTTNKQTDMDLLRGKLRRRRHHHMAVIVEAGLPPRGQGDAEKMHHRHRRHPV